MTTCWSLCIYVVARCTKLSNVNLFCNKPVYWDVVWFSKPAITRWYTIISVSIKFCPRESHKMEISASQFTLTCSPQEEVVQNSHVKEVKMFCILPVFISSELKPGVCCIRLLSPRSTAWRYTWKWSCHFHNFCLCFSLGTICLVFWPCLHNLWWDVTGHSLSSYVNYHTCHCQIGHRNVTIRILAKYHFNVIYI